ncbi:nitronate monooxygenase family protein [Streptomyces hirsutus]|uniref:Nitronate monooxygenase family protein n=1 Tax=Streptomyces hirsutus TaxID=35620 RepID=A0ABZ1GGM0_9ACTN|nr:nitronate monooxygenase family protein [Streptomyces hirsutus]WSD04593.1 nitronate monooxygenase family protein [Streptomyces hirsutus]WTD22016.1 nitronate monooxygenase family protein [Streptomyces hirsutus]WTD79396.1 nitronate monooxygenase family protein [Streptomyces sp. NBC_01635]
MGAVWQALCGRLGTKYPIMQDGMGPSPTTALATAVSAAGGLGSVSTPGLLTPEAELRKKLRDRMEQVAVGARGAFAVNIPVGTLASGELLPASETCIDEAIRIKLAGGPVGEHFAAITTSAGFPGGFTERIKEAGLLHFHKVGSVRHAVKAAEAGVDVVIASGYEMGGHTHLKPVSTMVLAPQVIAEVDIPVIVSGGIHDGYGLAAMLAMGAAGVAMGTRFIATEEHEWHQNYKQYIVDSREWDDMTYQGYYAPSRGLRNKALLEDLPALKATGISVDELNQWKEDRGYLAQMEGDTETGIVVAGQVSAAVQDIVPVKVLLDRMMDQALGLLETTAASLPALKATRA